MNIDWLLILFAVLINALWAGLNYRLSLRLRRLLQAQRQELDQMLARLRQG